MTSDRLPASVRRGLTVGAVIGAIAGAVLFQSGGARLAAVGAVLAVVAYPLGALVEERRGRRLLGPLAVAGVAAVSSLVLVVTLAS
jgi:hypothetical protein